MAQRKAKAAETREPLTESRTPVRNPKRTPSFGMCQGTRDEIERLGKAVCPFTGRTLTRDDL